MPQLRSLPLERDVFRQGLRQPPGVGPGQHQASQVQRKLVALGGNRIVQRSAGIELVGQQARDIIRANVAADVVADSVPEALPEIAEWEDHLAAEINKNLSLDDTQKFALVQARRGRGQFKKNVRLIAKRCRITGVDRVEHLIASHTKPWRDCDTAEERLDGENGLLLTPSIDHLFDRGYISFESNGTVLISPVAQTDALRRMGVPVDAKKNVGSFSSGQRKYLDFHREDVFLQSNLV